VAMCPKGHVSMPSPADVEKFVCKYASEKMVEDKAVDEVCKLLQEKYKVPQTVCKLEVRKAWDDLVAKCPKDQFITPSPADIEKLICKYASDKMIEDKAVDEVCALIQKELPNIKFNPDCKTVAQEAWDAAVAMCPKGHVSNPSPADIEKLVCKYASQKMIENRATVSICSLISNLFPDVKFDPDCKTVVQSLWDEGLSYCPKKGVESIKPVFVQEIVV